MKYFQLVWSSLTRRRARTCFTLASIAVAFLLFELLASVRSAFVDAGSTVAGAGQLITLSRMGFGNALPSALAAQIERIPGVAGVTRVSFFGGFYQKPGNTLGGAAVGKNYFAVNDTLVLPPEQLHAFQTTRDGMVVDAGTAKRFGWKIGDQVPVIDTALPRQDGSDAWTLIVVGIFHVNTARQNTLNNGMDLVVRWDYVDAARAFGRGTVDWYQEKLRDPANANRVGRAIDALSTNSDHETTTQTLNAFFTSLLSQAVNIGLIVAGIMAAVFFTLILLTGNTMAQAFRERIPELAVLKTIGFAGRTVMGLALAESMLLVAVGGTAGMLIATAVIGGLRMALGAAMPVAAVGGASWAAAVVLMLALGLIIGVLPAARGLRLSIVDGLAGR